MPKRLTASRIRWDILKADRVKEVLYESNEELEGGEDELEGEFEKDFNVEEVCANMDEEGYCCTGCPAAQITEGETCSYSLDASWPDCPCFVPIDNSNDSEFAEEA